MMNIKEIKKTVLMLLPAIVGLAISFNELGKIENSLDYATSETMQASTRTIVKRVDNIVEDVKELKEEIKLVELEPVIVDETIAELEVVVTASSGLNVREDNNTESVVCTVYPFGKRLKIDTIKGDWYKTEDGYINKDFVLDINKAKEENIITEEQIEFLDRMNGDEAVSTNLNIAVTGKSNLTLNDIKRYTSKHPGLTGIEYAVLENEYTNGVNAFFTLAVASHESGYGKSKIAKETNNLFGMNAQDHNPSGLAFRYSSKQTSVNDFANRIKKFYINQGRTTVDSIQPKYCPIKTDWNDKIHGMMQEVYSTIMEAR